MKTKSCLKLTMILLLSILVPALVMAQTVESQPDAAPADGPRIMLEESQSYTLDDYLRAFQVPIIDSGGATKYWDVTVKLEANSDGTLLPQASVTAKKSPVIKAKAIRPGTYTGPDGTVCTATSMTLTNGRVQTFFECTLKDSVGKIVRAFDFSLVSGLISDGHPFLDTLLDCQMNELTDVETYTWGITTRNAYSVSSCGAYADRPIGAKTNGKQLMLSLFWDYDELNCISTLTRAK